MNRTRILLTPAAAAGAAALLAACGAGSAPSQPGAAGAAHASSVRSPAAAPTSGVPPAAAAPSVGVAASAAGPILTDVRGRPVYVFTADRPGQPACNTPCLVTWPIVPATAMPIDPPGITAALGVLLRADGTRQLTVDGSPAYTFTEDLTNRSPAGEGDRLGPGTFELLAPTGVPIAQPVPSPPPRPVMTPSPTPAPLPAPVRQGNGGDHDGDNRGGPNDGDGGV